MFSFFKPPKFCHKCGQTIIHGPQTVYNGYDEQTGRRKEKTTQEWWCPVVVAPNRGLEGYFHDASFRHA